METLTKTVLPTSVLQDLVSKAVKASIMINQIALTCLMQVKVENNKLYVVATDNTNIISLNSDVQASDFSVVVDSKLFSAIVAKLTTQSTTLSFEGTNLLIEANGKYKIALSNDGNGNSISYPQPNIIENVVGVKTNRDQINSVLSFNKVCKANMKELPSLFNYYVDEQRVMTYDFFKACNNPLKLVNSKTCITPSFMELIPYVSGEDGEITLFVEGDNLMAKGSLGVLTGKTCTQEDINTYPIDDLLAAFNEESPFLCKLNRTLLLSAVERICLFVDIATLNKVTLIFNNSELKLYCDSTDSSESIKYLNSIEGEVPEVKLDIDCSFLKDQLASCNDETIMIKFGGQDGIQLQCNNVSMLLSVLGED